MDLGVQFAFVSSIILSTVLAAPQQYPSASSYLQYPSTPSSNYPQYSTSPPPNYPQYSTPPSPSAYPQYSSSPSSQYQTNPSQFTTPIPIISYKQEQNPDGSYAYSYQTGNGIAAEERGALKNPGTPNESNSASGYYSYLGSDGVQYSITYIADDNGYQPVGAHLPTSPPIPEAILKALQNLPPDNTEYDDKGFPVNRHQNYSPAPRPTYNDPIQVFGSRV